MSVSVLEGVEAVIGMPDGILFKQTQTIHLENYMKL